MVSKISILDNRKIRIRWNPFTGLAEWRYIQILSLIDYASNDLYFLNGLEKNTLHVRVTC